ncbi:hypothetical protein CerSpe_172670 [Prunus speciosa]
MKPSKGAFGSIGHAKNLYFLGIISHLTFLLSLSCFRGCNLSSLPLLLQRLYLRGRLETLPHCIPSLHSLVMLYLKWSRLKDDPLVFLQCLPNLVHLELSQVVKGDTVCFGAGGFKKLKRLGIDEFDKLRCIQDN